MMCEYAKTWIEFEPYKPTFHQLTHIDGVCA